MLYTGGCGCAGGLPLIFGNDGCVAFCVSRGLELRACWWCLEILWEFLLSILTVLLMAGCFDGATGVVELVQAVSVELASVPSVVDGVAVKDGDVGLFCSIFVWWPKH